MTTKPIPPTYIPVLNADGTMVRQWYEYLLSRDSVPSWRSVKVSAGGNVILRTVSQFICFIREDIGGDQAIYNLSGINIQLVSSGNGTFISPTSSPSSGKSSINYTTESDGSKKFRIYNNEGADCSYEVMLFPTL